MRFPWLQVDADFIGAHARDLGAHLGISRREAMGLALDLWTWALARAKDDSPPDGVVTGTGTVPDRLLAGSVEWTGPAEEFSAALVAVGLAVRIDGGYRLTGFDRYKATWEKNRRRTGRQPEGNRTGSGEEPVRKTQTQTQKKKETTPQPPKGGEEGRKKPSASRHTVAQPTLRESEPAAYPASPPADVLPHEPGPEPHGSQGAAWTLPDAVEAVHLHLTGRRYGYEPARDDKAATELMSLASAEGIAPSDWAGEVARRFGRALIRSTWQYERAAGKAVTLRELARRECWRINAEAPWEDKPVRDGVSGVLEHRRVAYDPWDEMLEMRGAA